MAAQGSFRVEENSHTYQEPRPAAYVKGWWHVAKCPGEMRRWEKATTILERGLNIERKTAAVARN
ncbi:hypothetical protein IFM47457_05759 [Aspergillus lentulus]|nr:hypothetical protein IFM47457_05759 [Aspergillus lentulus]